MVVFTEKEKRIYQYLMNEGHVELAEFTRANAVRHHEVFEQLKNADVESLYSSTVSAEMRDGMRRAIAGGDHVEVAALHSLLLSISEWENTASTPAKPDHLLGAVVVLGFLACLITATCLVASLAG